MTVTDVISDVLLTGAVVLVAACCAGLVLMPDSYQKLHFLTPAAVVAPIFVAAAVMVHDGYDVRTTQAWLTALVLIITAPVVGHATARAIRVRQRGDWRVRSRSGGGQP